MSVCQNIQGRRRQVCIGTMDHRITLETRDIQAPESGTVDFKENFTVPTLVWADIQTPRGKTFFDGVNTDTPISHMIGINFDASISATKTWVKLESGNRLRILTVEDLDGRSDFMMLTCTDRGNQVASQA